ncbi:ATP-binding protein [Nonomuraea sp. MCN248]|uniref:histidine kinase n=1 Tax=Nonomuraea corallina TaxID=2989783 RepID=A0ABT4SCQ2_9ACTN|nr:ATP-binding protein [Nonomuraea corallina]MDA0634952.1 ATP-binding protein [Nonomuraea corallina]
MITRFARSVRGRLTLLATVAMAVLCAAVSCYVLYALYQSAADYQSHALEQRAMRVVRLAQTDRLPPELPSDHLVDVQVIDAAGRIVSTTSDIAGAPRLSMLAPRPPALTAAERECELPRFPGRCNLIVVLRFRGPTGGDWLVYATERAVPWYVSPRVPLYLAALVLAPVLLTAYGAWRVVSKALEPVDRIRARLAEITDTDVGMRVPVPEADDEISALAVTANQTLERLEAAVERQRRFASDASHDLRSPITAMRTRVEEALLYPQETDWPETGRALLLSLDRLQAIVTDLLTLAKLDAGAPGAREPVDLAELAAEETAGQRGKRVVTSLQPGVMVDGDRVRLGRLITNLLDNAERHADSTIIVTVRRDGAATLEVLDDGAGVAPEHREIVFQRFTRLDASRSRDAGGTGLGLPIAREIAHAHGGTLTIEDSDHGARFVLRLPLRSD